MNDFEKSMIRETSIPLRELGYILDPKHYHSVLSKFRRSVKALHVNGLIEVLPHLESEVQPGCQVLLSEDMLESWLTFLDRNAVIRDDEIENMMQSIL